MKYDKSNKTEHDIKKDGLDESQPSGGKSAEEVERWYRKWMADRGKSGIATVNILDMLKDFACQYAHQQPVQGYSESESFLKQLRRLSVRRAINGFKTYENQPITYWTTAIVGEFGELCNMIKKMKRAENGGHDSGHSYTAKDITPKMLREELGGTLIYLDLLASILNIDLEEAITETFNEKSIELGFPYLIAQQPVNDGWRVYNTGVDITEQCTFESGVITINSDVVKIKVNPDEPRCY